MDQSLTIGRIVHYVLPNGHKRGGEDVPAIITRVHDKFGGCVQLTPFVDIANDEPVAPHECSSVIYSETKGPRTWHWPTD